MATEKKSIYERLMVVRQGIMSSQLKKSGRNEFQKFEYFELMDFVPAATRLFAENQIAVITQRHSENWTLTLQDFNNKEESIIFSLPCCEAGIKGASTIQNLGGEITYIRRYLYQLALDLVESDLVDSRDQKKEIQPKQQPQTTTKQAYSYDTAKAYIIKGIEIALHDVGSEMTAENFFMAVCGHEFGGKLPQNQADFKRLDSALRAGKYDWLTGELKQGTESNADTSQPQN